MKIKVTNASYSAVMNMNSSKHKLPQKQAAFWRYLLKLLSKKELKEIDFKCEEIGMERLMPNEPALILMNHSSFTDLQIAATLLAKRQYHIVCTNDGLVGKAGIMRAIGCIPTKKFIMDTVLVKDMKYCFEKLNSSVLMYPEASYSFDGSETPLPDSIGKLIKMMKVPVVMIRTTGAFLRDPLYNNLQKRKVKVGAKMEYIISPDDCINKSSSELLDIVNSHFKYDHFKEQKAGKVTIDEPFRADYLNRVLYKCPNCGSEDHMVGKGISIKCENCLDEHILNTDGTLSNVSKDTRFSFITDWYKWERECVQNEIKDGLYSLDTDVDIIMLRDLKSVYKIGTGHLSHTRNGFRLTGCDDQLDFFVKSSSLYSLYADYFWYEIGDMISIGDSKKQFYCFPLTGKLNVAKARLATEEMYKMIG